MNKKVLDLGINSESIQYEAALDVLGGMLQPYIEALAVEHQKPVPSQAFISYCEACQLAISVLQDELRPDDHETVERVLLREGVFLTLPR